MLNKVREKMKKIKIHEWLIGILFLLSVLWGMYYIFSDLMLANINSDTVSGLLKIRETLKEGSLIPVNWCYANTKDFPLFHFILTLIGFCVEGNVWTLRLFRGLIFLFFVLAGYFFARKVLQLPTKYALLLLVIWLCPFSKAYIQYIFMDGYGMKIAEWFLLIGCGFFCIGDKFKINIKWLAAFTVVQFLFLTGDMRWLIIFVAPYFLSLLWVWYTDNYHKSLKEGGKELLRIAFPAGSTVLALILGIVYQKIAYRDRFFATGYTGASLLNLSLDSLTDHFNNLCSEILKGMGYIDSAKQVSLQGILSLGIVACTVLLLVVLPVLMTVKYKTYNTGIRRILVFYWIVWAAEILTIVFSYNALGFRHVLYVILLGIGLSLYYLVNEIFLGKYEMLKALFAVAIGCYLAVNWIQIPVDKNASGKVRSRIELCEFLQNSGLQYGYGTYWNAGLYTVLSDFGVMIYPLEEENLEPYYWYNVKQLYLPAEEEGQTFLLLERDEYDQWVNTICFQLKYSDYTRTLRYGDYIILVYDYNIATKFEKLKEDDGRNLLGTLSYSENCYVEDQSVVVPVGETMFGPYVSLQPGHYKLTVECAAGSENELRVRDLRAGVDLLCANVEDGINEYEFDVYEELDAVELYLLNMTDENIAVKSVVLQQINAFEPGDMVLLNNIMLVNDRAEMEDSHFTLQKDGVVYGPYWNMEAGDYKIRVDADMEDTDRAVLRITANESATEILTVPLSKGENEAPFTLEINERGMEFSIINQGEQEIAADIYFEIKKAEGASDSELEEEE